MRRSLVLSVMLATLAFLPAQAQAQRSGRGMVSTPYGQFTMSELQAAGGDPILAEQNREQKRMMIYQQQMLKQQQQMLKQEKARQNANKPKPGRVNSAAASKTSKVTPSPAASSKSAAPQTRSGQSKNATPKVSSGSTKTSPATPRVPGAPDASSPF